MERVPMTDERGRVLPVTGRLPWDEAEQIRAVRRVEIATRGENFGTAAQRLRAITARAPRGRWYPIYEAGDEFPTSMEWEVTASRV